MSYIEVECPLCESTDFETDASGMHSCYICNTSWGSRGVAAPPVPTKFVSEVHEKLRKYAQPTDTSGP
jgi:ribosomal protein L37AE/L43A